MARRRLLLRPISVFIFPALDPLAMPLITVRGAEFVGDVGIKAAFEVGPSSFQPFGSCSIRQGTEAGSKAAAGTGINREQGKKNNRKDGMLPPRLPLWADEWRRLSRCLSSNEPGYGKSLYLKLVGPNLDVGITGYLPLHRFPSVSKGLQAVMVHDPESGNETGKPETDRHVLLGNIQAFNAQIGWGRTGFALVSAVLLLMYKSTRHVLEESKRGISAL